MKNESDEKLIFELEEITGKIKRKLESKDLALRKEKRDNNNLTGDEEAAMIVEMIRSYFQKYSYLDVHAKVDTKHIETWDDFINKMYNHIIY